MAISFEQAIETQNYKAACAAILHANETELAEIKQNPAVQQIASVAEMYRDHLANNTLDGATLLEKLDGVEASNNQLSAEEILPILEGLNNTAVPCVQMEENGSVKPVIVDDPVQMLQESLEQEQANRKLSRSGRIDTLGQLASKHKVDDEKEFDAIPQTASDIERYGTIRDARAVKGVADFTFNYSEKGQWQNVKNFFEAFDKRCRNANPQIKAYLLRYFNQRYLTPLQQTSAHNMGLELMDHMFASSSDEMATKSGLAGSVFTKNIGENNSNRRLSFDLTNPNQLKMTVSVFDNDQNLIAKVEGFLNANADNPDLGTALETILNEDTEFSANAKAEEVELIKSEARQIDFFVASSSTVYNDFVTTMVDANEETHYFHDDVWHMLAEKAQSKLTSNEPLTVNDVTAIAVTFPGNLPKSLLDQWSRLAVNNQYVLKSSIQAMSKAFESKPSQRQQRGWAKMIEKTAKRVNPNDTQEKDLFHSIKLPNRAAYDAAVVAIAVNSQPGQNKLVDHLVTKNLGYRLFKNPEHLKTLMQTRMDLVTARMNESRSARRMVMRGLGQLDTITLNDNVRISEKIMRTKAAITLVNSLDTDNQSKLFDNFSQSEKSIKLCDQLFRSNPGLLFHLIENSKLENTISKNALERLLKQSARHPVYVNQVVAELKQDSVAKQLFKEVKNELPEKLKAKFSDPSELAKHQRDEHGINYQPSDTDADQTGSQVSRVPGQSSVSTYDDASSFRTDSDNDSDNPSGQTPPPSPSDDDGEGRSPSP